jgi:hypothetical protein
VEPTDSVGAYQAAFLLPKRFMQNELCCRTEHGKRGKSSRNSSRRVNFERLSRYSHLYLNSIQMSLIYKYSDCRILIHKLHDQYSKGHLYERNRLTTYFRPNLILILCASPNCSPPFRHSNKHRVCMFDKCAGLLINSVTPEGKKMGASSKFLYTLGMRNASWL